jgi:hypothetical protein
VKLRNPLIALGILAGLWTYVYFVEIKGGRKELQEKESREHVFSIRADDVTGFTLSHGGERVRVEKVAKEWRIQEPRPAGADAEAVDRIVRSLEDLKISHDLGKQADLASYHLKDPAVRLEIQAVAKTAPPALSLGDDAPTGGGTYARLGDSDTVMVVTGAASLQGATLLSLRDKSFLKFDPGRLTACRILGGKEEIDLSRSEGKWSLSSPVKAAADDASVSDLIFALQRLTVSEFVDESPVVSTLVAKKLRPPQVRVALSSEEWKGEKELAFGSAEAGVLYALHPATGALVKVADSIGAKLKTGVTDLRKKDLLPFPSYEVSRLKISGASPQPLELERKSDKEWSRITPSAGVLSDEPVDLLLRDLSDLKADGFVDDPGKNLGGYGLSPPAVRIEIWKKESEKGQPAVLEIGRKDAKGKVPARDPAWPSLMLVPAEQWDKATQQSERVSQEKPPSKPPAPPASPSKSTKPSGGS